MKTSTKFLSLFAATFLAFASSSRAQIVTYQTVPAYDGSQITGFSASGINQTRGQTFTNIEAIYSLTYNFFKAGVSSTAASFSARFAEWNTGNSTWDTVQTFTSFTVPASGSWTTLENDNGTFATYAKTFNFDPRILTNPTATYALLLTNTSGSNTNFGIGTVFDEFAFGSTAVIDSGSDYTFSQIVIVPGGNDVPPIPESSTVAAILGCVLVAGLVGFRLRQQRQMALAPAMSAAA